jgi:hypothetical protein
MTRVAIVLAMVSALCLGVSLGFITGVVLTHHHLERELPAQGRGVRFERRGPPGVPPAREFIPHLQRLLDLSPAQSEAIRLEIERSRGDLNRIRDSLHSRIELHLTPEQRDRWRVAMRERNPGEPRGPGPRTIRAQPGREGDSWR